MSQASRTLAHRYEVGDLIGRGGMAEVHIGYDTRLGRTVAVKILRADLARDPSFQTRFRREAQAAAGLNHPSIVAVYDTGEEHLIGENGQAQTVPFIVMEYVEGHTVRDILKDGAAAPIDEAIEIMSGVLSALEYSHAAGLVHRDIKPANVMLTPTGAVKVMDFGIARALADVGQTMTQAQAVIGTAQYLSPEQARGEDVDARSDLYSAGCLLFELLCGRPPFVGDSPVAVAYQHVREAAPRPSDFAPDVPAALDQVVLRALAKSRDARYSNAGEFLADLNAVIAGTPVGPATGQIPLGAISGVGTTAVLTAAGPASLPGGTKVMPLPPAFPGPGGPGTPTGGLDDPVVEDPDERKRRIRNIAILSAAVAAAIGLIVLIFSVALPSNAGPKMVLVPDLSGMDEPTAEAALEEVGLVAAFEDEPDDLIAIGIVTRSDPPFEQEVEEGGTVTVYLSSGPAEVEIPSLQGLTVEAAREQLIALGLEVEEEVIDDHQAPQVTAGRVSRTDPAELSKVSPGSSVTLYVASGQVQLPDLVDVNFDTVQIWLTELRIFWEVTEVQTDAKDPGTVLSQSPAPGLVPVNSTVNIQVAIAIVKTTVPNVVGRPQGTAVALIRGANLVEVVTFAPSNTVPNGTVISSNPAAGTQVNEGTSVTIVVSSGPAPSPSP